MKMEQEITYGQLTQKLAWDRVPNEKKSSRLMDVLLSVYGGKELGVPAREYAPQDGIHAYILPQRGTSDITNDTIADGIIITYSPTYDRTNEGKGLDEDKLTQTSRSLADFMVMTHVKTGYVVEATVAHDDHPAKPSPREAFFRVVDFRYALHQAVDYVAQNTARLEEESIDFLVGEFARKKFPRSSAGNPRARLG